MFFFSLFALSFVDHPVFPLPSSAVDPQLCQNISNAAFSFANPPMLFRKFAVNIHLQSANLSNVCLLAIHLEFRPPNAMNDSGFAPTFTIQQQKLNLSGEMELIAEFDCRNVMMPGLYRVTLLPNIPPSPFSSGWFNLSSSSSSSDLPSLLPFASYSIFPSCQNDFSIGWTFPNCDALREVLDFRLRMLASMVGHENEHDLLYLEEFIMDNSPQEKFNRSSQSPWMDFLRIPCAQFDIIHPRFCFELISISRHSRHFQLWDRKCVRTEAITAQTNYHEGHWKWSEWSEWTACSCRRGTRKRTRFCRRSDPISPMDRTTIDNRMVGEQRKELRKRGGRCGRGEVLQSQKCTEKCAEKAENEIREAQMGPGASGGGIEQTHRISNNSSTTDPCRCGCRISTENQQQGQFFATICPGKGVQTWILEVGRPFRARIVLMDKMEGTAAEGMVGIWRDEEEEEEIKGSTHPANNGIWSIEADFDRTMVIRIRGTAVWDPLEDGEEREERGVLIEFQILAFYDIYPGALFATFFASNDFIPMKELCSIGTVQQHNLALCSIFLALFALFLFVVALVLPPMVLVVLVKRYKGKMVLLPQQVFVQGRPGSDSDALLLSTHCHKQIDLDLLRSDKTDSTRLSSSGIILADQQANSNSIQQQQKQLIRTVVTVEQRSIGIQLSRHPSPRCVSRQLRPHHQPNRRPSSSRQTFRPRTMLSGDHSNGSIESATIGDESNLDYWNEDDDFGAQELQLGMGGGSGEGSPSAGFVSDIDIDKLIRQETSCGWTMGTNCGPKGEKCKDVSIQFDQKE